MNILQVNMADCAGGAEVVALRLHEQFRARGHQSWMAVGSKRTSDKLVFELNSDPFRNVWSRTWIRAARMLNPLRGKVPGPGRLYTWMTLAAAQPRRYAAILRGEEDFDFPATHHLLKFTPERVDVLHLHNLHGSYFDLRALPELSQQVPTFLTLHDPWLFSGHCAHSFDCNAWKTGCGNCPDLNLYPLVLKDATASNWNRKAKLFQQSRLHVIAPSEWMMKRFDESMLRPGTVEARVIPHGVDLSIFTPGDKAMERKQLGVPPTAHVLLFSASDARRNPFKNFQMLRQAIRTVGTYTRDRPIVFIALGEGGPAEHEDGIELRFVAFDRRPEVVARYCRAADVYVHAAKAETFGVAITEAMACGTPVIATNVGGIPDQITNGINGFLIEPDDATSMAKSIAQLLADEALLSRLAANAARNARDHFGLDLMTRRYLDWYSDVDDQQRRSLRSSS